MIVATSVAISSDTVVLVQPAFTFVVLQGLMCLVTLVWLALMILCRLIAVTCCVVYCNVRVVALLLLWEAAAVMEL